MPGYADRKSRRQFATFAQPYITRMFTGDTYQHVSRGHDYPITARQSRNVTIPAPPPPRSDYLKSLEITPINSNFALLVKFEPADGFGDAWFSVYNNGIIQQAIYVEEGDAASVSIPAGTGYNLVSVIWTGDEQYKFQDNILEEINAIGQRVQLDWVWTYDILGNEDSELDNWVLDGLKMNNTVLADEETRRSIDVDIALDGGNVTITSDTFTGVAALGATATLTELNDSGVSGSVDVGALTTTETETLMLRLPQSMQIFRELSATPTTQVAEVAYSNRDAASWSEPEDLDGGVYYYRLQAQSDTDDAGDYGSDVFVTVPTRPKEPTNFAYASGDAADTVLSFTPSVTAGASYNLYMRDIDDEIFNADVPVATAAPGATQISAPATDEYPGTVLFILRAVLGTIEEKNSNQLYVEYDASGNYVAPRPNNIEIANIDVSSGRTIDVTLSYNTYGEKGVANVGQIFTRTPTGSYTFGSPDDSDTLVGGNIKSVNVSTTKANGFYFLTAKAATAIGTQSTDEADEVLVYVSDDNITSPTPTARILA